MNILMNLAAATALLIIGFSLGYFLGRALGWRLAHYTVAAECERLGGFFVGKQVYKCYEIKDQDREADQ